MNLLIRLSFLITLILTACTTSSEVSHNRYRSLQWLQHQQKLNNLNQYQINGACTYCIDGKKIHAYFFWKEIDQDSYRLVLTDLLGNIRLKINISSALIYSADEKEKYFTYKNVENIINEFAKIQISFNNLRQWIIGLPGDISDYELNDQYRLKKVYFSQNGRQWEILYNNYKDYSHIALPTDLELIGENQSIKLRVDNWTVK